MFSGRREHSALGRAARALTRAFGRSAARPHRAAERTRTTEILVDADPEAALLASAAALKRIGAKITRYDGDERALEARRAGAAALVSVRVTADHEGSTRLRLETGAGEARALFREFRKELTGRTTRR